MKAYRIKLSSWTGGFRYPTLITGYQPSLSVPPLTTVLGMINSALGRFLDPRGLELGYRFEYSDKVDDLETEYMFNASECKYTKSNVTHREMLFDCRLSIYVKSKEIAEAFKRPVYPILMGRSNDLAMVDSVEEIEMEEIENAEFSGQIIPYRGNKLVGEIVSLVKWFGNERPRKHHEPQPYFIMNCYNSSPSQMKAFADKDKAIYFHTF